MQAAEGNISFEGYTVIKSLSKNIQHEVLLANRESDDQKVALKHSLSNRKSFFNSTKIGHEYDILKDLKHEGITNVFELIQNGSYIAIVQEFIDGPDLRTLISKKQIPVLDVLDISIQLADILHYIHQNGIIHKDINPKNIMLTKQGKVKLIDFAISSNLHSETNDMLNIEQIEGTLTYISPEQTGRTAYSIKRNCDFYSFGILLYELIAGQPPFDSADPLEIIHCHLSRIPNPLSSIIDNIPEGLEKVISKLTEKNPDDRYNTALGLKADLEKIRDHYKSGEPLTDFIPGSNDTSRDYKQSQKLYGRDSEKKQLLNYYNELSNFNSMLVLVAGYSGVGKSALIRHVKYPIIQKGGTFISGKFDQFKQDIPYFAFIEGVQEFIKNLLSESEDKIQYWRQRFLSVLGDNTGLIAEVIPLISKIIKDYPEVPKLQPAEQESRFNMVLLDFITSFSSFENPLVIFLDDLQWADLSSLNLVKRIIENTGDNNILILGAYRDNEVKLGHPLLITLKQLESSKNQVKHIHLESLDEQTTIQITKDSFAMSQEMANELGQLVFSKTNGNPFFIHSFLKALYEKKLVKSELNGNWSWSVNEINKLGHTDNVVDLMTEGLTILPDNTQEILKYASILGNTFDVIEISGAFEQHYSKIYNELKPAIKGEYVNALDNQYRNLAVGIINRSVDNEENQFKGSARFAFSHDKVQQAAYNLIDNSELAPLHLKIGRFLLKNKSEDQLNEGIFELLNHFALSQNLLEEISEKEKIAELSLQAGRKAKDSTSYDLAVRFLEMGKSLLQINSWDSNYELTYNLLKELGECEYLNNNPEKAELHFEEVLSKSKSRFDKLRVYYIHSSLYLKMGNTQESLRLGMEAAKLYNIRFPKNKVLIQLVTLLTLSKYLFLFSTKYKDPDSLLHIKDSHDEENIALNKFLIDLATSAYQQDQNLMMLVIFKIIKLYLKHGFTDASGWGFSGFSVVALSALKMQKKGFNLWDLTIRLHKKTHSPLIKWRLSYTVLCFHNPWRVRYSDTYDDILETIKACVLNGDQIFTGYTVALYARVGFLGGMNLNELHQNSEEKKVLIEKGKGGLDFFIGYYQLTKYLLGKTNEDNWNDDTFNDDDTIQKFELEGNKTKLAFFHTARLVQFYFARNYNAVLEENQVLLEYKDNFVGDLSEILRSFFHALAISAIYSEIPKSSRRKHLKIFKTHLNDFKNWSKGIPSNFLQHYYLLQAELLAMRGKLDSALVLYEKSIETAAKHKFKYIEAIANERAAILCETKGLHKQSKVYLKEAWFAYKSWGAVAKCRQLISAYPELEEETSSDNHSGSIKSNSVTSTSSRSALDLASVLKASQSIASQVKYDDLLKHLLHIIIENAGAEKGCILLLKGGRLCLEAEGRTGRDDITIFPSIPYKETDLVPHSFINYGLNSEESEVVNDAGIEERFNKDNYIIEHNTQSMMCLPITSQGKFNGLLYLENNLLKGVFNRNRINLLKMLSGQIGISIDNALLYENLEEKVVERTKEIEKQKIQIQQEKEKSDSLLLNILPKHTADELKSTGEYKAQSYENVTVMFCDIVSFTALGERLTADGLVNELHEFFSGIDDIVGKYGIEKIKTIGDAYLCAAGLDESEGSFPSINMVNASLEIVEFLESLNLKKKKEGRPEFQLRIGMNSGPVTAGVVGKTKYAYDIWGDTVNTASRIESSGEPGRINISGTTYELVKEKFDCEYRGKIDAKNKGELDMYFVNKAF